MQTNEDLHVVIEHHSVSLFLWLHGS